MDSHYPQFVAKRKTRAKCPTIIQGSVTTFQFYRYRFWFRAVEGVAFPRGTPGNVIRGVIGAALYRRAPDVFRRLFDAEAGRSTASGLTEPPRPFVLRASDLDGRTIPAGDRFSFDAHVFAIHEDWTPRFREAFQELAVGRGRAQLERIEQLDTHERPSLQTCVLELDGREDRERVALRFATPTELKSGGRLVREPDFGVLFKRLRDRVGALRQLYGSGALDIDFAGLGSRSERVRMTESRIEWHAAERRSSRTGQVHAIGGFTGEAEYEGELGEFMPWLRAARWVGVGRQTVWGKGDVRIADSRG